MEIFRLSDDEAFEMFKEARWGDDAPSCPKCNHEDHYWIRTRKQWRCKACNHTFSVTSGTLFANHKLPLTTYLAAIALYSNSAKGMSALQMSRNLNTQYKTAWVLCHKLRESLTDCSGKFEGEVEIDACYVNTKVRPENNAKDRRSNRVNPNKRAVVVIRQRGEVGAVRSRTFVAMSENQPATLKIVKNNVNKGTTIFADEHRAYNGLHAYYETKRVNHSITYKGDNGECTNQAESFFSRFRRMQFGQVHKMSNLYLDQYANECAYREDTRRKSNGVIFKDIVQRCAATSVSRDFSSYWQSNKRLSERLVA